MNILLIEDDPVLVDGLQYSLSKSGYDVTTATTGRYAEALMFAKDFDMIILDLALPDMDGSHFVSKLRLRKNPIPILILTARDAVDNKVDCLTKGADDYMVKPFDLTELENRIHALIRRSYANFSKDIVCGRLVLDTREHKIFFDGNPLILFPKEYTLLEFFLLNRGRVVSKDKLAQRLFSDEVVSDNTIEVSVHRLRKRLNAYGVNILTLRGLGYMMEDKSVC